MRGIGLSVGVGHELARSVMFVGRRSSSADEHLVVLSDWVDSERA